MESLCGACQESIGLLNSKAVAIPQLERGAFDASVPTGLFACELRISVGLTTQDIFLYFRAPYMRQLSFSKFSWVLLRRLNALYCEWPTSFFVLSVEKQWRESFLLACTKTAWELVLWGLWQLRKGTIGLSVFCFVVTVVLKWIPSWGSKISPWFEIANSKAFWRHNPFLYQSDPGKYSTWKSRHQWCGGGPTKARNELKR